MINGDDYVYKKIYKKKDLINNYVVFIYLFM